ncbi:sensor histidine kinase [Roseospira marina]|nr:ATP-binding protein [Roseospira marina]MBB4315659.1 signal transduction histidine kinase [Roseospira marina]MBB5088717.1 signal transduction histidine kinase [Roseospira marina]
MRRSWTITHWLAATFLVAMITSGVAVGLILSAQMNNSVLTLARQQAQGTAHQVFQNVYGAMRRGTAHDEIPEIMARLNATALEDGSVRLVRGPAVAAQYGPRAGAADANVEDPLVRRVLETGEDPSVQRDGRVRHLFPLVLDTECTACHAGVVGETVNGLVDIDLPLSGLRQPLTLVTDTAFLVFMGTLALIFVVLFVTVRTLIVHPIRTLSDTMTRLSANPGRGPSLNASTFRTRELRNLATRFTTLMTRVADQRSALEDHARALTAAKDAAEAARIQADAANMAKSHFLASMSHELRTPLNAVMGFSEILRDEIYGPLGSARYREYATDILNSGQHLRDLVDDLLDLARIEAGSFEIRPEPLTLATEVPACLALFRERAAAGGLTLSHDCPDTLPPLRADPRAFRQILFNLVSNAVKYTPDGGHIAIVARATATQITLAVRDTGIGIPPQFHDLVFAAYGQVINVETRDMEGTGLGLSLVMALMQRHGGTVTLDSAPNAGSTFTVIFPRSTRNDDTHDDTHDQGDTAPRHTPVEV